MLYRHTLLYLLEVEACLQIDRSRCERARRLTQVRICDVRRETAGVDVQQVQSVEHVGLNLELRIFAQYSHFGQAERFGDGEIQIAISGTRKGVAAEPWRRDDVGCRLSGIVGNGIRVVRNRKVVIAELIIVRTCVRSAWVGKVASGFEGVAAGAMEGGSVIKRTQTLT